jgi:hypothetical protein
VRAVVLHRHVIGIYGARHGARSVGLLLAESIDSQTFE